MAMRKVTIPYTIDSPMLTVTSKHPNESGKQVKYYHGRAFINGVENVDVTLIVQGVDPTVDKRRFLLLKSVKHKRVMHPHFYTTYNGSTLVCYDRIESFLCEELIRKKRVRAPIDGQPDEITACDIRELSMGLEELHKNNLRFFDLNHPSKYVISKGNIKFCNIGLSAKENTDDVIWDTLLMEGIKIFGTLITWLLDTGDVWPEKDSFLQCFNNLTRRWCRDLRVIYTHPFLIRKKKYAVQILEDAHHALTSKDNDVRDYTKLKTLVKDKKFSTVVTGGNVQWLPNQGLMNPKFFTTLSFVGANPIHYKTAHTSGASSSRPTSRTAKQPQQSFGNQRAANTPKLNYKPECIKDLLRFLRNVYQHYYTQPDKINIGEVYDEIKKHWPLLIDIIHVASWT